jgi:hypothetical protein
MTAQMTAAPATCVVYVEWVTIVFLPLLLVT